MIKEYERSVKRNINDSSESYSDSGDDKLTDLENDEEFRKPKKILHIKKIDEKLYSKIKFEINNDGLTPATKWIPNDIIAQKYPNILIKYYEDKIKYNK
jgi:hypothetical protein